MQYNKEHTIHICTEDVPFHNALGHVAL